MDSTQQEFSVMNEHDIPLVLLHRTPAFKTAAFTFTPRLKNQFQWLDPLDESEPSASALYNSVRLMLCVANTLVNSVILDQDPRLECIVCMSTGLDHVDLAECHRWGIRITNAGDSFSDDVAEYAIGLLIDVLRRVPAGDRLVRAGSWPSKGSYPLGFKNSELCALGVPTLWTVIAGIWQTSWNGMKTSKRLEGFGIAYHSRRMKPTASYPYYENVPDLASHSDILIVACALAKETHHIINKEVLRALPKGGVIVNIGRGSHIDEKELVEFLVRGDLGGAGLDVFEDEPNVPEELYKMDNVVLSPHTGFAAPEAFVRLQEVLIGNIEAFFSNKPLLSEVVLQ